MARFEDIADVSFIGDITLKGLKDTALSEYDTAYEEITGTKGYISDENKAILYTTAQIFYQLAETINNKARQNLLKYASGNYLDNLGLSKGIERKQAEKAVVTVRFNASATRDNIIAIPAGTRVTDAAAKYYFAVDEYTEIAPGETFVDVKCTATVGGTGANDFGIGDIKVLADPIAYIGSVSNIEIPTGGADKESDDTYATRIYESRYLYSTTGSENAYIYYTKAYSTLIDDVFVTNPRDAEMVIYILMKDREEATEAFIEGLTNFLNNTEIRPMTDKITVENATRINYSIDVSYKIYDTDIARLTEIQKNIENAVNEYIAWQSERIGRDINEQKLLSLIIDAGACNVTITQPTAAVVAENQIAYCTDKKITYAGFVEE